MKIIKHVIGTLACLCLLLQLVGLGAMFRIIIDGSAKNVGIERMLSEQLVTICVCMAINFLCFRTSKSTS
jgi:hypothetical protein